MTDSDTAKFLEEIGHVFLYDDGVQSKSPDVPIFHAERIFNRMSDHDTAHPATTGGPPYFSPAEWEALQKEDQHAGKAVVGLMASIFTTGLLLYTGVMLSVLW